MRKALQARRKPTSSTPLPGSDLTLANLKKLAEALVAELPSLRK